MLSNSVSVHSYQETRLFTLTCNVTPHLQVIFSVVKGSQASKIFHKKTAGFSPSHPGGFQFSLCSYQSLIDKSKKVLKKKKTLKSCFLLYFKPRFGLKILFKVFTETFKFVQYVSDRGSQLSAAQLANTPHTVLNYKLY